MVFLPLRDKASPIKTPLLVKRLSPKSQFPRAILVNGFIQFDLIDYDTDNYQTINFRFKDD